MDTSYHFKVIFEDKRNCAKTLHKPSHSFITKPTKQKQNITLVAVSQKVNREH